MSDKVLSLQRSVATLRRRDTMQCQLRRGGLTVACATDWRARRRAGAGLQFAPTDTERFECVADNSTTFMTHVQHQPGRRPAGHWATGAQHTRRSVKVHSLPFRLL